MRVLQERLIPGHWANADQLQRWLIEDEIAKLIHAGYLEKFGEDGVCLTEKGKTHKAPVLDISEPLAFEPAERDAEADDAAQHDLDVALRRVGQLPWPVLVAFLLGGQFAGVAA
jgi:hypothetical protein